MDLQVPEEPEPPPVQILIRAESPSSQAESKSPEVVGTIAFDGFEMPVYADELGRRWCYFPRPFRLRDEINDWLFGHGAYLFDQNHYVIDDLRSDFCLYVQVDLMKDGRLLLCFLSHRDHWPMKVPIHAQRMRSTAQQQQQQKEILMTVGAALFAAALVAPRTSHIYHHRAR